MSAPRTLRELKETARRARHDKPTERAAEINRLRQEELLTLEQLGERFGVTRERIRQTLVENGYDTGGWGMARKRALRDAHRRVDHLDVVAELKKHGSFGALCKAHGIGRSGSRAGTVKPVGWGGPAYAEALVRERLEAEWPEWREYSWDHRSRLGSDQRYADEDCLESLRRVADGYPISHKEYDRARDPKRDVSAARIIQRFGNWNPALELAGVPTHTRKRALSTYQRAWTDERIDQALLDAYDIVGRVPPYHIYKELAEGGGRGHPGDWPSGTLIRMRLGGWVQVKEHLRHLIAVRDGK